MSIPENSRLAGAVQPRPAGDRTTGRTWTIAMPAGQTLLTANQRMHWSKRARITKQLRSDAFLMAKYAKIPALERAQVVCVYEPPPVRGVKDVGNLAPSAKALVDGAICDAGVLPDDSDAYMVGPDMRRGRQPHPGGRLLLIITELTTNGEDHGR